MGKRLTISPVALSMISTRRPLSAKPTARPSAASTLGTLTLRMSLPSMASVKLLGSGFGSIGAPSVPALPHESSPLQRV